MRPWWLIGLELLLVFLAVKVGFSALGYLKIGINGIRERIPRAILAGFSIGLLDLFGCGLCVLGTVILHHCRVTP